MDWGKFEEAGNLIKENQRLLADQQARMKRLEYLFSQERVLMEEMQSVDAEVQRNVETIERLQREMVEE